MRHHGCLDGPVVVGFSGLRQAIQIGERALKIGLERPLLPERYM
jgi:hypothetical protein